MPARIKTGDEVIVIGGKDRGKRGKVLRVEPEQATASTSRASTSSSATRARSRWRARSAPSRSAA